MKKPVLYNLIITLFALLVVVVLNSLSPSMPLASRAIVVGIAIDKDGDDVHLAAQIIQSGSSGESSKPGNSTYAILQGKGKSLSTAIYDITSTSGYYVSLAHCNAIILGESMRSEDCFKPLNYLVKNTKLADDTVVVFCEGKASELLSKEVGLSFLSAFGLKKLESLNADYSRAVNCTVRDFMVGDKTDTGTKVVPLCRLGEKIEEPEGAEQSTGKKTEFRLDEAVITGRGGTIILDEQQTYYYNLVKKRFRLGNVTLTEGTDVTDLVFNTKKTDVKLRRVGGGYVLSVEVEITFLAFSEGRQVGGERQISAASIAEMETSYAKGIIDVHNLCKEKSLDVFGACGKLYADFGIKPNASDFLKTLEITAKVKIKII